MKFSVGYQLCSDQNDRFPDIVRQYREHIAEVYFALVGMPSGRSPLPDDPASCEMFWADIRDIAAQGIELNFLINASCYGGLAVSKTFENCIVGGIEQLLEVAGRVDSVTTTSPAAAEILRRYFPDIPVRASVNMRIGSVAGMEYLADLFDGYYIQRDYNRDLEHLRRLGRWADANGKTLHLLANSGCLRFCSSQSFHDNLVSHGPDWADADNIENFNPYACWRLFEKRENWKMLLQATWIRPEDLHNYEFMFDTVKLATRTHQRPWTVIEAYTRGEYSGNLLDLLEPGYGPAFSPYVVDNSRFPDGWFEKVSRCGGRCEGCGYCESVLGQVLRELDV